MYFAGTMGSSRRETHLQKFLENRLLSFWDILHKKAMVPYAFELIKYKKKQNENRFKSSVSN